MIKFEHRPVRHGEDWIQIGGAVRGVGSRIHDPGGWVWALLEALDGTRTVGQVVADLVRRFPTLLATDVQEAVNDLRAGGYLQEVEAPVQDGRYERGLVLWRWMDRTPGRSAWDVQLLLAQARVTVVGVGGVGCTAALDLVLSGVGHVHCVDHDVVELSNLNRQILYTERDVGCPKVEVAVRRLREHNSDVQVTGEQSRVDAPTMLRRLATECDVLVMAADTPTAIHSWTSEVCQETGTAWVHGGYDGPQVTVGFYQPHTGPCHDCGQTARLREVAAGPPLTFWSPGTSRSKAHAANAVTAGVSGNYVAHAVMSLITGVPAIPANGEFGWNLVRLQESQRVALDSPGPDCPTCG
ncbi:ThiF family adenylyltransferase [Actinosynnema sp. ALI-1.44]|uniref:ThiF family adenylyltransferase n=1 Tax=Actinosynnema sp. ALI-1.44 TaxID=1933779 RepID=UPI001EDB934F|nr:ThiF family adenylyltransferase [Actinosynnema sp. ALI-1.44]